MMNSVVLVHPAVFPATAVDLRYVKIKVVVEKDADGVKK